MRIYTIYCEASVSAAKTLIEVMNSANSLLAILGLGVTEEASETADQVAVELRRISATGTGTAATAVKADAGDPAAGFTAKINDTVEPTAVAEDPVWAEGFDIRAGAGKEWDLINAPKVRPGTGNGIGLKLDLAPAAATTIRAWMRVAELG
ncbi:hypothetical protein L0152_07440 [bacterium]|nr:hypothetical protein [bacterium]